MYVLALAAVCAWLPTAGAADNCYDHQTETYDARFTPTYCTSTCSVTPFFSPDTSLDTYTSLIESATETIDIYTPGKPGEKGTRCTRGGRVRVASRSCTRLARNEH